MSCVNCGGTGHMASECKAEQLPKHKRPCFICRRPGHLARDCVERQAQNIVHNEESDLNYALCLDCEDEWKSPLPRKTFRPQRKPVTLADYISPKFFTSNDDSDWETISTPKRRQRGGGTTDGGTPDTRHPISTAARANRNEPEYQERKDPRHKIEAEIQEIIANKDEGMALPAELLVKGVDAGVLEVQWPDDDEEVNAAEDEEPEYIYIEITWDTGAGDSVLKGEQAPGHEVNESRGSRVGACFVAANNERINNEGEVHLIMRPEESNAEIDVPFQVANVSRPLWAISQVCDGDLEVLFTKTYATMRDPKRGGKEIARAQRKGGLYRSRMRVKNPRYKGPSTKDKSPARPKGFGRQGTRR